MSEPESRIVRVVVTGSECTGKTTLAQALASHYGTLWVPEFARRFVADKGAPPDAGDVEAIARGQLVAEAEAEARLVAQGGSLLVLDTDLLSTVVYARHYYGSGPTWIETALRSRPGDLYVLAGIDVPWVADGEQRDRGDRREQMQALFRDALQNRGLAYEEVLGDPATRLRAACAPIDALRSGGAE